MTFADCKLGMSDCAPAIHKYKPGGNGVGIVSVSLGFLQHITVLQAQFAYVFADRDILARCHTAYGNCLCATLLQLSQYRL